MHWCLSDALIDTRTITITLTITITTTLAVTLISTLTVIIPVPVPVTVTVTVTITSPQQQSHGIVHDHGFGDKPMICARESFRGLVASLAQPTALPRPHTGRRGHPLAELHGLTH